MWLKSWPVNDGIVVKTNWGMEIVSVNCDKSRKLIGNLVYVNLVKGKNLVLCIVLDIIKLKSGVRMS